MGEPERTPVRAPLLAAVLVLVVLVGAVLGRARRGSAGARRAGLAGGGGSAAAPGRLAARRRRRRTRATALAEHADLPHGPGDRGRPCGSRQPAPASSAPRWPVSRRNAGSGATTSGRWTTATLRVQGVPAVMASPTPPRPPPPIVARRRRLHPSGDPASRPARCRPAATRPVPRLPPGDRPTLATRWPHVGLDGDAVARRRRRARRPRLDRVLASTRSSAGPGPTDGSAAPPSGDATTASCPGTGWRGSARRRWRTTRWSPQPRRGSSCGARRCRCR